jgi:hypothetical protein
VNSRFMNGSQLTARTRLASLLAQDYIGHRPTVYFKANMRRTTRKTSQFCSAFCNTEMNRLDLGVTSSVCNAKSRSPGGRIRPTPTADHLIFHCSLKPKTGGSFYTITAESRGSNISPLSDVQSGRKRMILSSIPS